MDENTSAKNPALLFELRTAGIGKAMLEAQEAINNSSVIKALDEARKTHDAFQRMMVPHLAAFDKLRETVASLPKFDLPKVDLPAHIYEPMHLELPPSPQNMMLEAQYDTTNAIESLTDLLEQSIEAQGKQIEALVTMHASMGEQTTLTVRVLNVAKLTLAAAIAVGVGSIVTTIALTLLTKA